MEGLMQGFPIPIYFKEDIGLDIEIPKDLLPEGEVMTKLKSKELKDAVLYTTSVILQRIGYVDLPMRVGDMWFNKYDDTRPILKYHYHQNCAWTGTYYPFEVNHETELFNPNASFFQQNYPKVERYSEWNSASITLGEQKAGSLLIHPSYIGHQVLWNGGEPSYSVSFDIQYNLPIGDKTYGSYVE